VFLIVMHYNYSTEMVCRNLDYS